MKKNIILIIAAIVIVGGVIGLFIVNKKESDASKSSYLKVITGSKFKEKIENKDDFILLVTQTGCGHCETYRPVLVSVLEEYKITAYEVNLANLTKEEDAYLENIAHVGGTPLTAFIVDGEEETTLNRIDGNRNRDFIVQRLTSLGYIER